ncbi:hypothetical protein Vadar_015218 [Vaccinium darrowii]|uniref:Uncharacterized protein n=1 Tax=Vaccinium darrowii TaxID=229202 RepID=A0ACB7ZJC0_9ERIC|nr:hypothetical protein Vadar_015218 [Vaccinium darrowii]
MSRTLLSRIKSRHNPNPTSSSPYAHFKPQTKRLVNEVCQILTTHSNNWQNTLETLLSQEEIVPSDITYLVLDRIRDPELGLKFFDWVNSRPYGCSLDGFAYSSLLKLLAKSRVFPEIERLMGIMRVEDKKPSREALDYVIRAYSDSGFVGKAIEFYRFVVCFYSYVPSVFALNSLLNVLVKHSRIDTARQVYDEMIGREDGCVDNYSTCIVVRGLCKEGKVEEGRKMIEDRWGKGCIPNIVFYNTLIDGYCKKRDIEQAYALFKELKLKGFLPAVETYGAMINGFCKGGNFEAVDRLLVEMNLRGVDINVQVYNNVIDARFRHGCVVKAMETVRKMIDSGCEPDIVTYNNLINGSCKNGKVQEAEQLLEQATRKGLMPNKLTYTPIVQAYCRQGEFVRSSELLIKMTERGDNPDAITYGSLVHGLVAAGEIDVALAVRDKMVGRGVLPDACIYNILMNGLCKKGRLPAAKQLLAEMLDQNVPPDAFVFATLIDGFIRNGDLSEAKKLFELSIESGVSPDVVGFNTMIKGYCKFGIMNDAVSCINRMMKRHISPDEYTYSIMVDGYVKQHDLDGALRMFTQMVKRKCEPNVVTYTSLINGFCLKGDFRGAVKVFSEMKSCGLVPNVVTYSVLIRSFCKEGKLEKAASFFEQMLRSKCVPNNCTFHYLVNGFSRNGRFINDKKGDVLSESEMSVFLTIFGVMISDGWDPRVAACSSILVCLCLYGMLKTALQFGDKMVTKACNSDSVTFAALLHGICLEGRSREWKSIISSNLNEQELCVALKYSMLIDQVLPIGVISEASQILQTLIEGCRSHDEDIIELGVQVDTLEEFQGGAQKNSCGVIIELELTFLLDGIRFRWVELVILAPKRLATTFVTSAPDSYVLNQVQERFEVDVTELPEQIDTSSYREPKVPPAVLDGMSLCAFEMTWETTCNAVTSNAEMILPKGMTFLVYPMVFDGPTNPTNIRFLTSGTIIAPDSPDAWEGRDQGQWLIFDSGNRHNVDGGGLIMGVGRAGGISHVKSAVKHLDVSSLHQQCSVA